MKGIIGELNQAIAVNERIIDAACHDIIEGMSEHLAGKCEESAKIMSAVIMAEVVAAFYIDCGHDWRKSFESELALLINRRLS